MALCSLSQYAHILDPLSQIGHMVNTMHMFTHKLVAVYLKTSNKCKCTEIKPATYLIMHTASLCATTGQADTELNTFIFTISMALALAIGPKRLH